MFLFSTWQWPGTASRKVINREAAGCFPVHYRLLALHKSELVSSSSHPNSPSGDWKGEQGSTFPWKKAAQFSQQQKLPDIPRAFRKLRLKLCTRVMYWKCSCWVSKLSTPLTKHWCFNRAAINFGHLTQPESDVPQHSSSVVPSTLCTQQKPQIWPFCWGSPADPR